MLYNDTVSIVKWLAFEHKHINFINVLINLINKH